MAAGGGANKNNPAKDNDGGKAAANAEENRKKIKEIEASIMNLNQKFSTEIENIKLMQSVSGGQGGSGESAGASAKMFESARRRIEEDHKKFGTRMV